MVVSVDDFIRELAASGLMPESDVRSIPAEASADRDVADGEQVARELVRRKKLTAHQARQVYEGQGKSLVLGNYTVQARPGGHGNGAQGRASPHEASCRAQGGFSGGNAGHLGGMTQIGGDWGSFDGTIDAVRISKTARYDKDYTPPARFETDADTVAFYHIDEGTGDLLQDSSGNDHHGKIVGAKWVRQDAR